MMNRFQTSPAQVKDELARLMGAALHEAVRLLVTRTERQLFDLAAEEQDGEQRAALFQAIAFCRGEEGRFFSQFANMLLQPVPAELAGDWHELIGDRTRGMTFEDGLNQARHECGIEHAQFEARIGQLHADDPTAVPEGMYTLDAISRAFIGAIADFPDDLRHRLVAQWPDQVLLRLAPIYSVLNDYMIQVGILPGIKRLRDPLADVTTAAITPATPRVDEPAIPQHQGPSPDQLADRLIPLVRATREGDDQYLFRFERDQEWRAEDFAGFIMDRLEPTLPLGNWPAKSRELIRLVGTTFSDVLNDAMISPRHRRQIAELQLAVLYFAIRNRHFFSDADHPLRRIINHMALIGSDPDLSGDPERTGDLLGPIQEAILDQPERLDELSEQMQSISRGKPLAPKTRPPNPARQRLALIEERCRSRVEKIIAGHTNDLPLREPTRGLLDELFTPFMVRTMINQGRQSAPWADIIEMLHQALTLQIDPTITPEDVEAFSRQAHRLFSAQASDDPLAAEEHALDAFIAYLHHEAEHTPALSVPSLEEPASPPPSFSSASEAVDVAQADPVPEFATEEEPGAAEASALPPTSEMVQETPSDQVPAEAEAPAPRTPQDGLVLASLDFVQSFFAQQIRSEEWFEVHTGPGRALRRLKMRDLDRENGVLTFANRTGHAELSLPLAKVIDDLLEDRSRLVFENSRFIRSLEHLREQLEGLES